MTQQTDAIAFLNTQRLKAGLPGLNPEYRLMETAQQHAEFMHKKQALSHAGIKITILTPGAANGGRASSFSDRIRATGYLFSAAAENIALGALDPAGVIKIWMESPPHRANILNPEVTDLGIGLSDSNDPDQTILRYWSLSLAAPIKSAA
jgi:uncharacterized protein YkwD